MTAEGTVGIGIHMALTLGACAFLDYSVEACHSTPGTEHMLLTLLEFLSTLSVLQEQVCYLLAPRSGADPSHVP